ncbi:hypothetical protein GH714_034541 [Hevea brasiliensis]|uniref:Uncharacterized protein n=1 Tax=Hevea brasiliensis TaxID=3981 RepID=A0A6A6KVC3_HEVBR|nr:hypothetical protein GH714_034541 [Hevea brasiliensis]
MDSHNADVDMSAADEDAVKELDEMKKRLKEMEEEAAALREMQLRLRRRWALFKIHDVEHLLIWIIIRFVLVSLCYPASAAANQANKEEADSRSVFVGNVRK